jgi:hypothetical protein
MTLSGVYPQSPVSAFPPSPVVAKLRFCPSAIPTNVGVAPARAGGLSDLERDVRAVKRSNRRAQESADRGDYVDALGWLKVIEAIVGRLSSSVQVQQQAWGLALAAGEHGKAQTQDSYEARVAGASRAAPSNAR